MRHLNSGFKLGKNPAHRRAVLRNLVTNLDRKRAHPDDVCAAKAARPLAERMITLGKRDSLHATAPGRGFSHDARTLRRNSSPIWHPDFRTAPEATPASSALAGALAMVPSLPFSNSSVRVEEERKEIEEGSSRRSSGRKKRKQTRRDIDSACLSESPSRLTGAGFCFYGEVLTDASAFFAPLLARILPQHGQRSDCLRGCTAHRIEKHVVELQTAPPRHERLMELIEGGIPSDQNNGAENPNEPHLPPA